MASLEATVHLPTYVALKATYGGAPFKYLGVEDDGKLAYSTDSVVSDRAKFAVESAGDGIVHIRSCYNNKYWASPSESEKWIVATEKVPVEDKNAQNCTLFRTNVSDDGKTVKFVHVQLGRSVGRRDVASDRDMYLCLEPLATTEDVSEVVDYGSIVILPQYVAFKDPNGFYLNSTCIKEVAHTFRDAVFASKDVGDEGNTFEIRTNSDGLINVICVDGKKWQVRFFDDFQIGYYSNDDTDSRGMLFSVYSIDKDIIALRYEWGIYYFVKMCPRNNDDDRNMLKAISHAITSECRLQIVEPVLAREINVFHFHSNRERIYGIVPLTHAEQTADNPSDYVNETTLQFTIAKTTTKTWNTSKSGTVTTKATITGGVPFVEEGSIEIGIALSIECDLGGSVSTTEDVQSSYNVKVPPHTRVTVTAISTQGKCDVPFSYDQVDHLPNGVTKRTTLSDGVFTGVNSYNFNYQVKYEPLKPAPSDPDEHP